MLALLQFDTLPAVGFSIIIKTTRHTHTEQPTQAINPSQLINLSTRQPSTPDCRQSVKVLATKRERADFICDGSSINFISIHSIPLNIFICPGHWPKDELLTLPTVSNDVQIFVQMQNGKCAV